MYSLFPASASAPPPPFPAGHKEGGGHKEGRAELRLGGGGGRLDDGIAMIFSPIIVHNQKSNRGPMGGGGGAHGVNGVSYPPSYSPLFFS